MTKGHQKNERVTQRQRINVVFLNYRTKPLSSKVFVIQDDRYTNKDTKLVEKFYYLFIAQQFECTNGMGWNLVLNVFLFRFSFLELRVPDHPVRTCCCQLL